MVETNVPSQRPRMGEVNTSSVGMLGSKKVPSGSVSPPPCHWASGMSQHLKSVPLGAW